PWVGVEQSEVRVHLGDGALAKAELSGSVEESQRTLRVAGPCHRAGHVVSGLRRGVFLERRQAYLCSSGKLSADEKEAFRAGVRQRHVHSRELSSIRHPIVADERARPLVEEGGVVTLLVGNLPKLQRTSLIPSQRIRRRQGVRLHGLPF